ncbi:MarR family winged helix-turn-helix transcriptional regulator [Mesorhizobium amorphae]|uniref:MarR family winged helix-turn-helix transcriptional regulator n=1 Tax=Mesorhizobium amorphae TaxID=71433 RepID=UPI001185FF80|nr:MarR family winged helix-turn-helix transcriptional regulator [Mesorhizobium amorphae]
MKTPQDPLSLDFRIGEGLSRLAMAHRVDDWDRAKATGLNPTQLAILGLLERRGETGLGVKEIAAQLGVSQPTASDSINALERKEYVAKHPGMIDKRAVRVVLTTDGLAVIGQAGQENGLATEALAALDADEREDLLLTLIKMIRHLQETGAIPVQRMCVSCRYFAPFAHADAARPHHCKFVDAAFGQRELRIDCRDHVEADPSSRAATWDAFQTG